MVRQSLSKSFIPRVQLRLAREMAGWSQIELADRLNIGQVTVSHWETGETTPSPYYCQRLSHLFGKTLDDLDLAARNPSSPPAIAHRQEEAIIDPVIPPLPHIPLVGREEDLVALRTHLCDGQISTFAICGLPGVGKTTLACTLAHDALIQEAFPDGILWAGLGTHPDLQNHLVRWGTLLGLSLTELRSLHDGNRKKDLLLAVRSAIGSRHFLLIFDDAWTAQDALAFQRAAGSQCTTLITTRFPTLASSQGRKRRILQELTTQHSLDLLALFAPQIVEHERDKVHALIQAVGGLPLALTLMGNYLRLQGESGQTRRIQAALEQVNSLKTRFELSEPWTPLDHHPSLADEQVLTLDSIIGITDQQLHPAARHALYALSVLPPKPESFSEEAALAVTGCSLAALDELLDMGLLEAVGNERYTLHQTIADYARLHLDNHHPHERFIVYALTFLEGHRLDYERLVQESSTLLLALEVAYTRGSQRELVRATCIMAPFLILRGNYALAQHHLEHAQQAALALQDQAGLTTILLHVGDLAGRQGNYVHSQKLLQEGITYARRLGDNELLCALLSLLGRSLWKQGIYTQAEVYLQEGLLLARQIGSAEQIIELLSTLGNVAASMGEYARSKRYLEEGLTLARQTGDRKQLCMLLMNLGATVCEQGRGELAYGYLEEGLRTAQQIGHREWICVFLLNLGDVVRITHGDYVRGSTLLQESLQIARQIGHREWAGAALVNLTELEIEREDYQQARVYNEECATEAEALGITRINVFVLFSRGILALVDKHFVEAETAFREMQRIVPSGDVELQSFLRYGQARLAAGMGQLQQARLLGEASASALEQAGHYRFQEVRRWLDALPPQVKSSFK